MAWRETCPMNEKVKFIADWQNKEFTMAALCRQYNISRKTGYKILARYDEDGVDGLKNNRVPIIAIRIKSTSKQLENY